MKRILFLLLLVSNLIFSQQVALITNNVANRDTPPPASVDEFVMTTTSTSATWSPQVIENTGATLVWKVTGDITPTQQTVDLPTFNLTGNTGTAIITIESSTGFIGWSDISANALEVTGVTQPIHLPDMYDFSMKQNYTLNSIDLGDMPYVYRYTLRDNNLSSVDLSNNALLSDLYIYGNVLTYIDLSDNPLLSTVWVQENSLTTESLDNIVNTLDSHGITNGNLNLDSQTGGDELSSNSYNSFENLVAKGWTITPSVHPDPIITIPSAPTSLSAGTVTSTTIPLSWTKSVSGEMDEYRAYIGGVLEKTFTGDVASGTLTELSPSTTYSSITVRAYNGLESLNSNSINATTAAVPTGTTPILTDFNITNTNKDRVYFTATASVEGLSTTGFKISGKNIDLVVVDGDGLGGYFRVTSPFTYWDNNTIRLGEVQSSGNVNPTLHNFTLEYITNNITEPSASTNRYVAVGGTGNGTSEGAAASMAYALTNCQAGETWWVKAGSYGTIQDLHNRNGTSTSPIKFIGYKSTIGDITSNYYDYGETWSTSEMPTFTGTNQTQSTFAIAIDADYFIMRNFQFTAFYKSLRQTGDGPAYCEFDRINLKDHLTDRYASAFYFRSSSNHHMRVKNSVAVNTSMGAFEIRDGQGFNLFENVKSYSDSPAEYDRNDYHITLNKGNNIIRNCYTENHNDTEGNGSTHGITLKGFSAGSSTSYNLIEKNTVINVQDGIMIRNYGCNNNIVKDNLIGNNGAASFEDRGGLWIKGGNNYNIFERNVVENVDFAIGAVDNELEDGSPPASVGTGNIFRNNTFRNCKYAFYTASVATNSPFNDNYIYNNTFHNITQFNKEGNANVTITGLEWKNNIFNDIAAQGNTLTGMTFDYNVFYNSWSNGIGSNDSNINPVFANESTPDFRPTATWNSDLWSPRLYEEDLNRDIREASTTRGAIMHASE